MADSRYLTLDWWDWEYLTGIKQQSSLALACMYSTIYLSGDLEWHGDVEDGTRLPLSHVSLQDLYRYWYLMVKGANKRIADKSTAVNVSRKVEELLFGEIGYRLILESTKTIQTFQVDETVHNESQIYRWGNNNSYLIVHPGLLENGGEDIGIMIPK